MIILATNNQNKVDELSMLLNTKVYSLKELGVNIEIIEDGKTLYDNALIKAKAISKLFENDTIIADDTGLFVNALNGNPGVHSARYDSNGNNVELLIKNLASIDDRIAYFETVIVVIKSNQVYSFSGIATGSILREKIGTNGFGYDSVFYCDTFNKSYGELSKEEKNLVSHRSIAIKKLIDANIL